MAKKKKLVYGWINLIFSCWLIVVDQIIGVMCLKDLKIFVPDAVIMGNAATLSCQYDLGDTSLYSVRWYFESEEFYRFVPKEAPPARTFPVSGITVDLSKSDSTSVALRGVTRDLTGHFQCEVSEDAPLFHTDIRSAKMQVIELPKDEPTLQIDKKSVAPTDNFKAVCTVGTSFPAANISWFINGKKVDKSPFQRMTYRSYEGTYTTSSLEVYPHSQVHQDAFYGIPPLPMYLDVLCEISILHIYHKNVQQTIFLGDLSLTTVSPNLLHLEGSNKPRKNGDPDNSPLTGGAAGVVARTDTIYNIYVTLISLILLFLCQPLLL